MALGTVACGRMHDLVAEHGRQFGLAVHFGQQAAVDRDLAARQRPGIRYRVVDHIEFVGKLPVRHSRQPLTDPLHVVDQGRVECEVAALGLTQWCVLLRADVQFPLLGNHDEVALAGDRVDRAAGCKQQYRNKHKKTSHHAERSCARV